MGIVIVKPAASAPASDRNRFALQMTGTRLKVSPDLTKPITDTQLPDDVICNPVFLDAAEREVLGDLGITTIDPSDNNYERVVGLVQNRLAYRILTKIPNRTKEAFLGESATYQEYDFEKQLEDLDEEYKEEVEPISPPGTAGDLNATVELTTSRLPT